MSRIAFIVPSVGKQTLNRTWSSSLVNFITGRPTTFMPSLAGMVFAALTPARHTFIYVEDEIEEIDFEGLNADLVAITAMTNQAVRAYQIAGEFRKQGSAVVIGGIHATVMREEAARHCDAIMLGEGENTWPAMLADFERGELKEAYDAKDYPPVTELVSPRIDVINHDSYLTFPIQATKGCPNECDFCSIRHSSGHRYRMKPVETVVREIREYEKYNKSAFAGYFRKSYFFVDDNLYVNREYTKKLFAAMAGLGVRWDGQGTLNTANDDEVLKLMAASGCRSFSIGFESVSQKSLEEANKPKYNVVSSYSGAVAKIQKHGMVAGGYFVMGFDSDEVTIFQDTRDFIYSARLFLVFVNLLTPYPGTALHERYEAARKIFSMSWECYNSWTCLITPKRMSSLDLQNGFYWLCNQAISIENMKRNVSAFWDISSWADKKTLTLKERIVLLLICLKLQTRKEKSYSKFLVWAATRRNAKDVEFIMWCTLRFELNENRPIREPYNPADKRRELAAGRAG